MERNGEKNGRDEPMITVIILYWNRKALLLKTLESFCESKHTNFNVVIVDNNSPEPLRLENYPFEIHILRLTDQPFTKSYISAHNYGFYYALKELKPKKIIIQHAEIYHNGDIISFADKVTDKSYISFGCYSLGEGETPETVTIKDKCMTFDGESAWYNHITYRPRFTHFCSAITTENLRKLNGFDERFCNGIWYDDDYFLLQVKRLGLEIELCMNPFVFHQNHKIVMGNRDLIHINQAVIASLQNETYKAKHILTPDL